MLSRRLPREPEQAHPTGEDPENAHLSQGAIGTPFQRICQNCPWPRFRPNIYSFWWALNFCNQARHHTDLPRSNPTIHRFRACVHHRQMVSQAIGRSTNRLVSRPSKRWATRIERSTNLIEIGNHRSAVPTDRDQRPAHIYIRKAPAGLNASPASAGSHQHARFPMCVAGGSGCS